MIRKHVFAILFAAATLAGCTAQQQTDFNAGLIQTTQNLVALNDALVKINKTLIDNAIGQAKAFAPYQCGAYALASAVLSDSDAAAKVNRVIKSNLAADLGVVAVKDVCAALGYSTTITASP